ncbi:PaaI family thioesterase [Zestomonas carbonaria]|uniref:Acyl-coenzyme A thioesterase PaaI n=1 Tax=Zestomonas carbonaria TaxID=2762745 RepID=A0A7U7EKI4_9GAMM|nr:PaaI family thioesterase [Pseudomonas carbonaria]CAD5105815.1 Acyl-coenzyme A thioesterase PaaI [Pseudomonas carbonaria]
MAGAGGLAGSAFSRLLGLETIQAGDGRAEVRMTMHDGLRNVHGKLHGGALFSLIDTAMGQACHSLTDGVPVSVTLESKINYIRPVSDGELLCRAWVLHAGKRTLVVEAETLQGDKLVAKAQATFARI